MFKYYNSNPNGYEIPDCVIRAIQTALRIPYYKVVELLHRNSLKYNCDELCVMCYENLLDEEFGLEHYNGNGKTAKEISEDFCNDILIMRMNGHLTCSIYGDIYDLWDCSRKEITDFWIVRVN